MGYALAALAALAAVFSQTSTSGSRPQTVWSHAHTTIAAFAQDGSAVAWFAETPRGCNSVHLRSLNNGLEVVLPSRQTRNVTCSFARTHNQPVRLALAGTTALWTLPQESPLPLDYLLGAGVGDRVERRF